MEQERITPRQEILPGRSTYGPGTAARGREPILETIIGVKIKNKRKTFLNMVKLQINCVIMQITRSMRQKRREGVSLEKTCDLHTHSVYSDGTYTPRELIAEAERIGLSAVALTDHNTVAGLPEFLEAAKGTGVEAVPGIEFSSEYQGMDLHILALFVQPGAAALVSNKMEQGNREKEESNRKLTGSLAKKGYFIDYEEIRSATPNGQVNRALIAEALRQKGYVHSVREAFETLLDPKFGLYQPPRRPSSFEIIEFARSIGAVPVLAHPLLKLDEQGLRCFLDRACAHGLCAMETLYSSFDEEMTQTAQKLAREFGLLQSGGSDFHGTVKPDISLGRGRGGLRIPMELLEALRQQADFSKYPKKV